MRRIIFALGIFTAAAVAGTWLLFTGGSPAADASPGSLDRDGRVVVWPGQADLARSEGDLLAAELLSDGRLSFEEYDRVTRAFVACVEARGGQLARPLVPGPLQVYAIEFTFPPRAEGDAAAVAAASQAAVDACASPTYARISAIWSQAHQPSPAQLRDAHVKLVDCLRAEGLEIPEAAAAGGSLFPFIRDNMEAFVRCSGPVSDALGMSPGYFGGF